MITKIKRTSRPPSSRAKSAFSKISKRKTIKYALTPEEMYKLDSHQLDIGIEGYEIPKKHFDYHQAKWVQQREKILKSNKRIWPPKDWPRDSEDNKIKPKKKTYLDDLYKWCNSYYDKEKAESLIEEKGIDIKDYVKPRIIDKQRRKNFLENEKKKEEWRKSRPEYPEYKQDAVDVAIENKKNDEEAKIDPIKKMIQKYKGKPETARCDKISVVSEAQFLGEQVPFYDTYVKEDETLDKNKLFFPKKDFTWHKAPIWRYPKNLEKTEQKTNAEEQFKEKIEELMNNKDWKKEDVWINLDKGFHQMIHHGELLIKFQPEYKMKDTEQYAAALEKNPKVYIGPQQYWKMPKETFSKKKANLSSITDDNGNKIYYMDRKKTDKRVYSAGLRKAVY